MILEPFAEPALSVRAETFKIARAASYVRSGDTVFVFFGFPASDGTAPSVEISAEDLPFRLAAKLAAARPGDEVRIVWRVLGSTEIMRELDLDFAQVPAYDQFPGDM
jgi:hypothetical protein